MPEHKTNPFFHRAAITDPRYFFGRAGAVRDVLSLLANGQSVSIIGSTKIGKSSLTANVSHESSLRAHGLDPSHHVFAHMSFGGLEKIDREQFFALMLSTLASQNPNAAPAEWCEFQRLEFTDLLPKLQRLTQHDVHTTFVFDEFEFSARNPDFDMSFLSALRSLASEMAVSFITASQRHLHEEQLTKQFLGSPFYNILQSVPVGLMAESEASEMVLELAAREGVDMADCLEPMHDLAGLHPYFLQVLAYYLFEERTAHETLDDASWQRAAQRFSDETTQHFEAIWAFLWDEEKAALGHVAQQEGACPDTETLKRLRQLSLTIEGDAGRVRPFSGAFVEFIQSHHTSYPNVVALVQALEAKDVYTRGHSDGVARVALAIAGELGMDHVAKEQIRIAARLHDIGKIGIPDEVLQCKGRLDEDDWATMRRHPTIGAEIIGALRLPDHVTEYVRGHQERLDGSGYPDGLGEDQLSLGTRIMSVADVYNALTTPRVYRDGKSYAPEQALAILQEGSGTEFDPSVVDAVARLLKRRGGLR